MSELVARAAAMAERAQSYSRDRMAELQRAAERGRGFMPIEWRALVEIEISRAFVVGYAARDEQTAAGRLPRPRSKRK